MIDKNKYLDRLVDQAVREYELDPVPPGFHAGVMARVEKRTVKPVFRFSWVDFSLSALMAAFIGVFLELIQIFTRSPYWSAWIQVEFQLLGRDLRMFFLHNANILLVSFISLITVASLLSLLTGVYRRWVLDVDRIPV